MTVFFCNYDLGRIGIAERDGQISNVYLTEDALPAELEIRETPLLKEAARQLKSYLEGELKEFSLPLAPKGTDFMAKVWSALREIPYGKTVAYGDIAQYIGLPRAARAVGMANNRNPIPIFVPCHRVIGKDGSLTGYGGGLELKKRLLYLERANS